MDTASLDFLDVTELAGDPISSEQLERVTHRYVWASKFCPDKDVAEIACGTGPGIGLLNRISKTFEAADYSGPMLEKARAHYGDRIKLAQIDAQDMPYEDASKDVLIILEAIYYLQDLKKFIDECRRVLRPGGTLLLATANKDLPDFSPSPFSHRYLGTSELAAEFGTIGSEIELFGYLAVDEISGLQRSLRPIKRLAVNLGLMPKTMRGKRLLKRLVFGPPVRMPAEITGADIVYNEPTALPLDKPDRRHKVIYCAIKLQ